MGDPMRFETDPAADMPRQAAAVRPGAAAGTRAPRVLAIDLLRGLAVMGMIMVAYAGGWDHRFTFLTHADWRGFAIADMIFPAFLFCAGAALVLPGVVLNLLPGFDVARPSSRSCGRPALPCCPAASRCWPCSP